MVTLSTPDPPGTGNVNIEEAEKLLKPYLNRYPKVSSRHLHDTPGPARLPGTHGDPHECRCRAPSSCSSQGGLKPLKAT